MSMVLAPESGVSIRGGRFLAQTHTPWLRIVGAEAWRGRWVELRYRTGLFENPVRPVIRFHLEDGAQVEALMNGALEGRARWIGRVPEATVRVSINPVERPGGFGFAIDEIRPAPRVALLLKGWRRDTFLGLLGIGARLVGSIEEARHCFRFAAGGAPLSGYDAWMAKRARPADLDGLDAVDWAGTPPIRLALKLEGPAPALETTLASVEAQYFPNWTLVALASPQTPAAVRTFFEARRRAEPRFTLVEDETAPLAGPGTAPDALAMALVAGDALTPYALGAIALAAREADVDFLYGDEDVRAPDGRLAAPRFKPDFSPQLQAATGYIGRGMAVRVSTLARAGCAGVGAIVGEAWAGGDLLAASPVGSVKHLRRIVHRRAEPPSPTAPENPAQAAVRAAPGPWPSVSIVLLTRNHARMLATCLEGLDRTTYPGFDTIIVDNGSTKADALALLDELSRRARTQVLRRPGPFNYSALCNDGAAVATGELIVFLNDDTEVLTPDWLSALAAWAVRPEIGVVGARLLFRNGRIQHTGVVLGLGGISGHVHRRAEPGTAEGWPLEVAREVSAVTGAVIAMERWKFEAVGGFDADAFPVLYNDTDLCLRLAQRGWRTMIEPAARLIHLEGVTRGRGINPLSRHGADRRAFLERWREQIRDDPYFHPALSLFAHSPELP